MRFYVHCGNSNYIPNSILDPYFNMDMTYDVYVLNKVSSKLTNEFENQSFYRFSLREYNLLLITRH